MKKVILKRIGDSLDMNSSFKKYPLFGNCDYADLLFNLNDAWEYSLTEIYGNKINAFQRENCTKPAFDEKTLNAIMGSYNDDFIKAINAGNYFKRPEFKCTFAVNTGNASGAVKKACEQPSFGSMKNAKAIQCQNNEEDGKWYYPVEKLTSKLNLTNSDEFKVEGDYKMKKMCDKVWFVFAMDKYEISDNDSCEKGKAMQGLMELMNIETADDLKAVFGEIKKVVDKYYVGEGYPADMQLNTILNGNNMYNAFAKALGQKEITFKDLGVLEVNGVKYEGGSTQQGGSMLDGAKNALSSAKNAVSNVAGSVSNALGSAKNSLTLGTL